MNIVNAVVLNAVFPKKNYFQIQVVNHIKGLLNDIVSKEDMPDSPERVEILNTKIDPEKTPELEAVDIVTEDYDDNSIDQKSVVADTTTDKDMEDQKTMKDDKTMKDEMEDKNILVRLR